MKLEPITSVNWRAAGALRVAPGQLELVAGYEPIAFVLLARTYLGFENAVSHPLVAIADEPVGVLALIEEGTTWTMRNLMIDARFQRRGHGRAVVLSAVEFVRERGGEVVQLTVHPSNAAAIHLYESLGFTYAEERDGDLGMTLHVG